MSDAEIRIEPVDDPAWLAAYLRRKWGEPGVVSRGKLRTGAELSALRAGDGKTALGAVSWYVADGSAEIVTLDSDLPRQGIGTRLLEAAVGELRKLQPSRLWLITTNDNLDALRFYQRRGWRLAALYVGAVAQSRRLKPSIPVVGAHDIPIRDEIELEFDL